jgi:hypothetical protein
MLGKCEMAAVILKLGTVQCLERNKKNKYGGDMLLTLNAKLLIKTSPSEPFKN